MDTNNLRYNILDNKSIEITSNVNPNINSLNNFPPSGMILYGKEYNEDKDVINLNTEITRNFDKLNQISNLSLEGSKGKVTFSNNFIKSISNILLDLKHQPEIFPTFSGDVQLEYENDEKYLEIEINSELKMNVYKKDKYGYEYETINIDLDAVQINKELDWFYG